MKKVLWSISIALSSSIFSFLLFHTYYTRPLSGSYPYADASFVNYGTTTGQHTGRWEFVLIPPVDFTSTSNRVTGSVVNVVSLSIAGSRISSGSGVIYSTDGYLITNYHVIEKGMAYEVTLNDKRRLAARLVGVDSTTDIALLKIEANLLQPIRFGDSDKVQIGEWVLAVGNPFNLASTVTAGIISAKARDIDIIDGSYAIESFIQTDAVVNPGNSGGALVNAQGELIGINTAIVTESGRFEGYSFAIPANLVRKVVDDLVEFGEVKRAILGVSIRNVDDQMAERLGLSSVAGIYITSVVSGGSAEKAGLQTGDVITGINGIPARSAPELQEQLARYRPGDRISLQFYRNGRFYLKDNILLQSLKTPYSSN